LCGYYGLNITKIVVVPGFLGLAITVVVRGAALAGGAYWVC
jgi:hypothetical protein